MLTNIFFKHMLNMSSNNNIKKDLYKKRKTMKKQLKKYIKPGLKSDKVKKALNFILGILE